jgi:hypothetical protein
MKPELDWKTLEIKIEGKSLADFAGSAVAAAKARTDTSGQCNTKVVFLPGTFTAFDKVIHPAAARGRWFKYRLKEPKELEGWQQFDNRRCYQDVLDTLVAAKAAGRVEQLEEVPPL